MPSALQQTFSGYWERRKEIQIVTFLKKQHEDCKLLGKEYSNSYLTTKYLLQTAAIILYIVETYLNSSH